MEGKKLCGGNYLFMKKQISIPEEIKNKYDKFASNSKTPLLFSYDGHFCGMIIKNKGRVERCGSSVRGTGSCPWNEKGLSLPCGVRIPLLHTGVSSFMRQPCRKRRFFYYEKLQRQNHYRYSCFQRCSYNFAARHTAIQDILSPLE